MQTDHRPSDQLETTGAALLVEALQAAGVSQMFGLPGVHNLAIWSAAAAASMPIVGVRHEQTAVYAADGAARTTGEIGVAVTTTGPGAANALGATGEAWASGSPVLVIATDIPSTLRRPGVYRGVLHETTDQAGMFEPVVKRVFVVDSAAEVKQLAATAIEVAMAAPQGPVYLQIPTDLLAATIESAAPDDAVSTVGPADVDDDLVERAVELLSRSKRPLIWAGGGAARGEAGKEVGELARLLGCPVLETFQARGLLPLDHPSKVGVTAHDPHIGQLWDLADVVIAIGTDFDGMTTQNWLLPVPPALIAINVDAADATKNYSADIVIEADARAGVSALLEKLSERGLQPENGSVAYLAEAARRQTQARDALGESDPEAATLLRTMGTLPAETPIFADMCIPGYWIAAYHPVGLPRRLAYPVGWGTLGFAFPASFGAAVATGEPVLCVSGDGGFLFACGELAAVAQEQAPVTILVVEDGGYGMLRYDQIANGDEPAGTDLSAPDFTGLADAFGIKSRRVGGLGDELAEALAESLDSRQPQMIVVEASLQPPISTSPRWYRRKG